MVFLLGNSIVNVNEKYATAETRSISQSFLQERVYASFQSEHCDDKLCNSPNINHIVAFQSGKSVDITSVLY